MNYEETLTYIHSISWRGSKPGLSRTRELLARLGDPQKELKFVHIAGTNGKGSVSAMTASILTAAGYKTGLYTSPYVNRFNERICVDGVPIGDAALSNVTTEIRPHAEKMADPPTEFELITAVGFAYFFQQKCDIVVLEVGLGGTLDSTNVIDTPLVSVITDIALDHTRELGNTVAEIASQKAGIIKGGTVVCAAQPLEAQEVIEDAARRAGAKFLQPAYDTLFARGMTLDGITLDYGPYKSLFVPLCGTYQPKNTALALCAIEALRQGGLSIEEDDIRRGLAAVTWPARFEVLLRKPAFILDGAHNPHGVKAACESLRAYFPGKKIVFLMGVMADKDVASMLDELCPMAERFVTVTPKNPRAMKAETLSGLIHGRGVTAEPAGTIEEAIPRAIDAAGEDGAVCAIGSLYMCGRIREFFHLA